MFGRQKIAMVVAEVFGTAVLAIAVYSMVARTSFPLFGGLAAGLVVAVMTLVLGNVSSAHFNPAVTLGLWSVRKVKTTIAIVNIAAQMLGGVVAWLLLKYFLGHNLDSLIQGGFEWIAFFAEGVGALVFVFGFAAAIYQRFEGGKLAFCIGTSLLIGILIASMGSNGVVNPAVALAMRSWNWAYAVGPLAGAIVGANLYALLFAGDYPVVRIATASSTAKSSSTRTTTRRATTKSKPRSKSRTSSRRR